MIELRAVMPADLDELFRFQLDEEANRMAAFTAKDRTDRAAYDAHIAKILGDPTCFMRTVWADGVLVGSVGKFIMFDEPNVTYWIGREYWGKGYATSALQALLSEFPARPLFAAAAFDNAGSAAVLKKCGFQKIGSDRGFANARGEEIEEHLYRLD